MFLSDVIKYFQTLTLKYFFKKQCDFRAQTQGQSSSMRTPTLTATSSFSNVPLKQIWSKSSIIFVGTTYKRAEQQSEMSGTFRGPVSCVTRRGMSHPGYFDDGAFCDLLVDAEPRSTLEEGDGFPQVSLGHSHQCSYALDGQTVSTESLKTSLSLQLCVHVAVVDI